jgi:hypothetical protein
VAEFDILYGVGISREGSLIDLGVEQGIVRKSGAWYTYEGDQLGQGKEKRNREADQGEARHRQSCWSAGRPRPSCPRTTTTSSWPTSKFCSSLQMSFHSLTWIRDSGTRGEP